MSQDTNTTVPYHQGIHDSSPSAVAAPVIEWIGRYQVLRILGQGGFGQVYLAFDEQLSRHVAVKTPHARLVARPEDAEAYLREARTVARLEHSGIVPVYDCGATEVFPCYVVSRFIDGTDLAVRMQQSRLSHLHAAELVATVAETLHYAHQQGLVHRDIKPANILLDSAGKPYVADFGLALREQDLGKGPRYAGTPAYMSPEQARGEGHRVDGRSDIFSLGVVLYELLTGRRPFHGDTQAELLESICTWEIKPPRQFDDTIPKELERICFAALTKRASERYSTAKDFADDLRHYCSHHAPHDENRAAPSESPRLPPDPLASPQAEHDANTHATPAATPTDSKPIKIVPKGLRSFDAHDADFFLELLPGPRDRDGLPASLRFWKTRIEEFDPDQTFAIGLIYGPSGCGKSSLVKAGLLPRLSPQVVPVYLEATPDETETRLLLALRKRCPTLPDDLDLKNSLSTLRRGQALPAGEKVLIVLDQFEQWLHAHREEPDSALVQALRQCDGGRVQCLVMVRDDFWLAVSRFLRVLEIRLLDGHNCALADLFDAGHARQVLAAFGRAFGRLSEHSCEWTAEEQAFLRQAVEGLAEEGKVVSVRLALFAEMMKARPWTPAALREVGGATGVGATFLEETFVARSAAPQHRYHCQAAQRVLTALLPETGTQIKGSLRSRDALLSASGYSAHTPDFAELLQILDAELRLITPTESSPHAPHDEVRAAAAENARLPADLAAPQSDSAERADHPSASAAPRVSLHAEHEDYNRRHYQLTHDYLVPSLRDWLTRKQRETRRGRAELRLAERSALWNAQPENRRLPALWEFVNIRLLTRSRTWTAPEQKMMRRAGKLLAARSAIAAVLLFVLLASGLVLQRQAHERHRQQLAARLVDQVLTADLANVAPLIEKLAGYRDLADPALRDALNERAADSSAKLNASLALLPVDSGQTPFLLDRLKRALPDETRVIRAALSGPGDPAALVELLLQRLSQNASPADLASVLPAAATLATLASDDPRWPQHAVKIVDALVQTNPVYLGDWMELLHDVRGPLLPPLATVFRDTSGQRSETERELATTILDRFAADRPAFLAELCLDGDEKQFRTLFPRLEQPEHRTEVVKLLKQHLAREARTEWSDPPLDPSWKRVELSAQAALESAHGVLAERSAFCLDMPWDTFLRTAESLRFSGYRPTRVRPFPVDAQRRVAAVWTRDGRNWQLHVDLDSASLPSADAPAKHENLVPEDVAAYAADASGLKHLVLWTEAGDDEDRRLVAGLSETELTERTAAFVPQGFAAQLVLHAVRTESGQRQYAGIWSKRGAPSTAVAAYAGWERYDQPQVDVCIAPAAKLADPLETYRRQRAAFESATVAQQNATNFRLSRAIAHYYLAQPLEALADLDFLLGKNVATAQVWQFRAQSLARLGRGDEARAALEKFVEVSKSDTTKAYVGILVSAWLKDFAAAEQQLEAMAEQGKTDGSILYDAACSAAQMAAAVVDADAARAQRYRQRAIELLRRAKEHGYRDSNHMQSDADLAPLHAEPAFLALLEELSPPQRAAGLWRADPLLESRRITAESLEDQGRQAADLLAQGYRPAAVGVMGSGSSMVWQHPFVPDDRKEKLAQQQAAAALCLLRLGELDAVWPLLTHRPDPRLRSYLLSRVATGGATPEAIIQRLASETDVSIRRALILCLGDFAALGKIPGEERQSLIEELARLYADDPDPGIHAAAEWALRQLGGQSQIERVRTAYATSQAVGKRDWYVTRTGGHTMVVLRPTAPFLMGSPVSETERFGGPAGRNEIRHLRQIERSFAIAAHEVTVEQFERFRASHEFNRQYAREDDAPASNISWYDAAEYCNWLSRQEGLPEDHWCYDPKQKFADGMTLYKDYLRRTGYRLPTEAEWEYAGRAGAATARCYGETDSLLPRYAWYTKTSQDRWMLPVGTLRPNDCGVFDAFGNIVEWCQDQALLYSTNLAVVTDIEQTNTIKDSLTRVLRGGSFYTTAPNVRSASRATIQPALRYYFNGFRPARTYP